MSDRTFYPSEKTQQQIRDGASRQDPGSNQNGKSWDVLVAFEGDSSSATYRANACSCYAGEHFSVTARRTEHEVDNIHPHPIQIEGPGPPRQRASELNFWPTDEASPWRVPNESFVDVLWTVIQELRAPTHGIIAVAGSTGSRKTAYARELARRYISERMRNCDDEDGPHIVTYEDPIESWFAYGPKGAADAGFSYTPRQKRVDVASLPDAVTDALRQKPSLLYVNEVRTVSDWRSLLFFAGTGHLAITTTHAGTLVEAFDRILAAAKARTPDERSRIASSIIAVVHLRKVEGELVPTMWVQTRAPALV